jgi:hypothetical protein
MIDPSALSRIPLQEQEELGHAIAESLIYPALREEPGVSRRDDVSLTINPGTGMVVVRQGVPEGGVATNKTGRYITQFELAEFERRFLIPRGTPTNIMKIREVREFYEGLREDEFKRQEQFSRPTVSYTNDGARITLQQPGAAPLVATVPDVKDPDYGYNFVYDLSRDLREMVSTSFSTTAFDSDISFADIKVLADRNPDDSNLQLIKQSYEKLESEEMWFRENIFNRYQENFDVYVKETYSEPIANEVSENWDIATNRIYVRSVMENVTFHPLPVDAETLKIVTNPERQLEFNRPVIVGYGTVLNPETYYYMMSANEFPWDTQQALRSVTKRVSGLRTHVQNLADSGIRIPPSGIAALASLYNNIGDYRFSKDILPHLESGNMKKLADVWTSYVAYRNGRSPNGNKSVLTDLVATRNQEVHQFFSSYQDANR